MKESEKELEGRMALWEHLDDLRGALVRSLLVVGLALVGTYNYSDKLVHFIELPLLKILPKGAAHLYYTGIADKFVVYFKVSALAAVAVSSPYLLFEVWKFVSPALYRKERRFVLPFLVLGTLAFLLGMVFAYEIVIPYGYKFLIEFGSPDDRAMITLTEYFDLTLKMLLGLGLIFELPVVLMLLGRIGIVNAAFLVKYRRHAFLAISIGAAVLTPSPDAFTLAIVMVPLYLLYEASIIGVRWVTREAKE